MDTPKKNQFFQDIIIKCLFKVLLVFIMICSLNYVLLLAMFNLRIINMFHFLFIF